MKQEWLRPRVSKNILKLIAKIPQVKSSYLKLISDSISQADSLSQEWIGRIEGRSAGEADLSRGVKQAWCLVRFGRARLPFK